MSAEHAVSHELPIVRRGYDIDEVDSYISSLETLWESKIDEATARIARLENELEDAKRREEAVHLTLVAATKTKEELMEAAQRDLTDATGNAREQAEKVLSEAQFEAFRLVTEANKDAEQIIDQARNEAAQINEQAAATEAATGDAARIIADAEAEAERIRAAATADADASVAAAQSQALEMLTEIKDESERMVAEREHELERMRSEFETQNAVTIERIRSLQATAEDLESRLRTVASGALGEVAEISSELTSTISKSPQAIAPTPHEPASHEDPPQDDVTEPASADIEPEPEAATERQAPEQQEPETIEDSTRGSFYSRRSARLPRIGSEAASGALAAVSAMRAARTRDDNDIEIVVTEGVSDQDVAMQSA